MATTGAAYVGTGGSSGTTSAGVGWTNLSNAEGSTTSTYASSVNITSGAVGTWTGASFGLSVPAGSTITSVDVSISHYESNTTRVASVTGQLFNGSTALGSPSTLTRTTSNHTNSFTYTVSGS